MPMIENRPIPSPLIYSVVNRVDMNRIAKRPFVLVKHVKNLNSGFTLIEIMIAVGIFAVISAIIFPIVIKTININASIEKRSEEIAGLQRMFVFMENDFRYMVQRTIRDPQDGLSFDPSFAVETDDNELVKFFT